MEQAVRIDPVDIPAEVYETGCRILSKSIRTFYAEPKNRRGYEEWLKIPEGQRADLSKEEREKQKADTNQTELRITERKEQTE